MEFLVQGELPFELLRLGIPTGTLGIMTIALAEVAKTLLKRHNLIVLYAFIHVKEKFLLDRRITRRGETNTMRTDHTPKRCIALPF